MENIKKTLSIKLGISEDEITKIFESDDATQMANLFSAHVKSQKEIENKIVTERLAKKLKAEFGIQTDEKKPDVIIGLIKDSKKETKPENNGKEEALKLTLAQKEEVVNQLTAKLNDYKKQIYISEHIPATLPKGVTKKEALAIIQMNLPSFVEKNNEFFIDNEYDDKGNEVKLSDKIKSVIDAKGWNQPETETIAEGRNGKGNKTNSKGSIETIPNMVSFLSYLKDNQIDPSSDKANELMQKVSKNGLFKF